MSKVKLMDKTEHSLLVNRTSNTVKTGISFMKMTCNQSQPRVNSIKTSDSMSKDHSTSSHYCQAEDMSTSLTRETLSSRHQTATNLRYGGSTKSQELSNLRCTKISQWTSRMLVEIRTFRSGNPIADGSRSSSMLTKTL
jgi:hypothetical protein